MTMEEFEEKYLSDPVQLKSYFAAGGKLEVGELPRVKRGQGTINGVNVTPTGEIPRRDQTEEAFHRYAALLGQMIKVAMKDGEARVNAAECGYSVHTLAARLRDAREASRRFGYKSPEVPDVDLMGFTFSERPPFVFCSRRRCGGANLSQFAVSTKLGGREYGKFAESIPYSPAVLTGLVNLAECGAAVGPVMIDVGEAEQSEARSAVHAAFPNSQDYCEWVLVLLKPRDFRTRA